jgi:hypothetical protein
MTVSFDEFPVYDPLVQKGSDKMSAAWIDFMATFYMNLISYMSQNGIFLPQLTTVQRNQIQSPLNGQMIYNSTLGSAQYFKAGVWTSF